MGKSYSKSTRIDANESVPSSSTFSHDTTTRRKKNSKTEVEEPEDQESQIGRYSSSLETIDESLVLMEDKTGLVLQDVAFHSSTSSLPVNDSFGDLEESSHESLVCSLLCIGQLKKVNFLRAINANTSAMDGKDLWEKMVMIKNKYLQSLRTISNLDRKLSLANEKIKQLNHETDVLQKHIHANSFAITGLNTSITAFAERSRQIVVDLGAKQTNELELAADVRQHRDQLQRMEIREETERANFEKTIDEQRREINSLKEQLASRTKCDCRKSISSTARNNDGSKPANSSNMHILDEDPCDSEPDFDKPLRRPAGLSSPETPEPMTWFEAAKLLSSAAPGNVSKKITNPLGVVRVPVANKRPGRGRKRKLYSRDDDPI
ncbi:Hypothetical protein NTJ_08977 [Nesidiocoris tenuis]|uniref:Uncharacterized protein n=1 Tax=Nesidiocoris tenuis TaxID=355587 RepID=A0ABN7AXR9_9HEMI|nr:Hypothetical protein NTJ_08977 [Nesidiocoris tenuis]